VRSPDRLLASGARQLGWSRPAVGVVEL